MVVGIVLMIFFIPRGDDNREIELVFNQMIKSGNEKNLEGLLENISLQYRDEYGATYPVVKEVIKRYFKNYDGFDARYSDLVVSITESEQGLNALANLNINVVGFRSGTAISILGSEGSTDNLIVTLEKSFLGDWKIKSVQGIDLHELEY
jgi:hypothetical protein